MQCEFQEAPDPAATTASVGAALFDESERLEDMAPGIRLLRLETALSWAQRGDLWPITFGLACCAVEMLASKSVRIELGGEVFRVDPGETDLMILSGRLDGRMARYVARLAGRLAAPGRVIGFGDCLRESAAYHGLRIDRLIPGCPPRPDALIEAIESLAHPEAPVTWPDQRWNGMMEER